MPEVSDSHARQENCPGPTEILAVLARAVGHPPASSSRLPREDATEELRAAASAVGARLRPIALAGAWWREDQGPMIGRRGDELVPMIHQRGRYHLIDPRDGRRTAVQASIASNLAETGILVRFPLPAAAGARQLLRTALSGTGADLRAMIVTGVAVATIGLAAPILIGGALGALSDGRPAGLFGSAGLYLVLAVAAALLTIVLNLRALRFEDRLEADIQLGLWDRLLSLPPRFFARASDGELAHRFVGIAYARQTVGGLLTTALLALLTACAGVGLLVVLGSAVIGPALSLVAGIAVLGVFLGRAVVRRQRAALGAERRSVAMTEEMLRGVAKLKTADAGGRAFERWRASTITARIALDRVGRTQAVLSALAATLPIAAPFVLVFFVPADSADFFTVNAGLALLLQAATTLLAVGMEFATVLPRFDDIAVLMAEPLESDSAGSRSIRLVGAIDVDGVDFTYPGSAEKVAEGLSFRIAPGEFVAIVGPSGSGKSTLLRLLLGFERPDAGTVRYDGHDLAELDLVALRRQLGVVLQSGQLFGGTIRENISGAASLGIDQVREAAVLAGIDEDIHRMPMGLNTMVRPDGGTLSVGQRQRVLIARALATHPRVLFFDEATSALDNGAQEVVTASTRRSAATRVVVAHRLSTVRDADRILVMERGSIVQSGTFAELLADEHGLFARLAARQLPGGVPARTP